MAEAIKDKIPFKMVSEHNARLETNPVRKLKGYKFKGVGEEGRELKTSSKGGKTC